MAAALGEGRHSPALPLLLVCTCPWRETREHSASPLWVFHKPRRGSKVMIQNTYWGQGVTVIVGKWKHTNEEFHGPKRCALLRRRGGAGEGRLPRGFPSCSHTSGPGPEVLSATPSRNRDQERRQTPSLSPRVNAARIGRVCVLRGYLRRTCTPKPSLMSACQRFPPLICKPSSAQRRRRQRRRSPQRRESNVRKYDFF